MLVIIGWAWGKLYFSEWAVGSARAGASTRTSARSPPEVHELPVHVLHERRAGMTLKRRFMPDMGGFRTMARSGSSRWRARLLGADHLGLSLRRHPLPHVLHRSAERPPQGEHQDGPEDRESTMSADVIDAELERFAKEHPDVKYVVSGHTHQLGVKNVNVGDRVMLNMNPGTWSNSATWCCPR